MAATERGRLAGKIALITGVGNGIGQACALLFARQGAQVLGCDRDAEAAEQTRALARAEGLQSLAIYTCDLTQPAAVKTWIEWACAQGDGGFDCLVNAAAFGAFAWIEDMDYEAQWRRTLTGELDIVFLVCQAAWPVLKARGGGVVLNFASANARMALEGSPALAHCAGKGGVLAMTRQLAMEGGPHNIRANTLSPGLIETQATRAHMARDPELRPTALSRQFLRERLGMPEDVAWAAVFLASDEAVWITGADLAVDAGATAG